MSGNQRRPQRRDGNESELVKVAQQCGATWMALNVTDGPDGVLGYHGAERLVHIKQPGKVLTKAQLDFSGKWRGRHFAIVSTAEEMRALLIRMLL